MQRRKRVATGIGCRLAVAVHPNGTSVKAHSRRIVAAGSATKSS